MRGVPKGTSFFSPLNQVRRCCTRDKESIYLSIGIICKAHSHDIAMSSSAMSSSLWKKNKAIYDISSIFLLMLRVFLVAFFRVQVKPSKMLVIQQNLSLIQESKLCCVFIFGHIYHIYSDKNRTFATWILAYILPATYTRNTPQGVVCFHEPEKYERITQ